MENASYVALSQQMVLRDQLAMVAQNVANMNTPGYKAQRMLFREFLVPMEPDAARLTGSPPLAMVIDQAVVRDTRPGSIDRTGNELDVALVGDGYLAVETPAGPRYTRNGRLSLDADRTLIDGNGLPVLDRNSRRIEIPDDGASLTITGDGTILVDDAEVAQLGVFRFDDPEQMRHLGGNILASNERPERDEETRVAQGMIEQANIQGAVEMTQMMELSRAYSRIQSLIKSEDERLKGAIEKLGKI